MFHDIPPAILQKMAELEEKDAVDRQDGTPRLQRLRQIPPITGKFIALMASGAPQGNLVEIGTSAGYSSLWLSLVCKSRGQRLITFEIMKEKIAQACETFQQAEVEDYIELVAGDAREKLSQLDEIAFCFLDAEKEIYQECYELVVPKLVKGGLILADNSISARETLGGFLQEAEQDLRVDALDVPIGKGVFVCKKI
ncbi:MAG: class I SAM-dependent methyltransferase [Anaerolineales bacterium]|nr:class I SAM-dependent methyltransferase [Anaerolineales bacterium]